jgi:hypothetical protein
VFWESAKSVETGRVQLVLMHMDEKQIYGCVSRAHDRIIYSIGILPKDYKLQHKSRTPNMMGLAAKGFIVSNTMRPGGDASKFKLHHTGRMCPAKKDSYKRVYRYDGTFH